MLVYSKESFDNLHIHDELDLAFSEKCIGKDERENVKNVYPTGLYTPNMFIRIGLFVLTVIIVFFSAGLFAMFFLSSASEKTLGATAVFFGLAAYGALEVIVQQRRHYQSGVDDALSWISAGLIIGGLNGIINMPVLANCLAVFFVCLYLALRFADRLMSAISCMALLAAVFFTYTRFGDFAKATAPFAIMASAALLYLMLKKLSANRQLQPYRHCLLILEVITLVCFYLAGNYLVRETSNVMFELPVTEKKEVPFNLFFWVFTIVVPFVYIIRGIQKKDAILLRVGLFLAAVMVWTVRPVFQEIAWESIMTTIGVLLIAVSYIIIRYLGKPRHGFTYAEPAFKTEIDKLQLESLVIVESFGQPGKPADGGRFGGGSGGGAGASGDF
ncbi:MAG TPA: hypothetical protein VEZ17_09105 [Chitinophagaceae bacterium]|nr:hypothetical protein [Chitinophagaceae bacterium]